MTEGTLIALLSGPLALGVISATAYIWRQRDRLYEGTIKKQEEEIAAYRAKIAELQDRALAALQAQLDEANKRIETDKHIAMTIEKQNAALRTLAGAHEAIADSRRTAA